MAKISVPESPLEGFDWPLSAEEDLAYFLYMLETEFNEDTSNPLTAFEAVAYIAAYKWGSNDNSNGNLEVPWWAVQAIAIGFQNYREGASTTSPITLGEAYYLEGHGQGKSPKIMEHKRKLRDIRIALGIAIRHKEGIKIEAAIQEEAEIAGLSSSQVHRIWSQKKLRANTALKNFQHA